jgi:hypothetical protein
MAGSKRWFSYTLDDGTTCGVQLDESNTEFLNGAGAAVPAPGARPPRQAPKGTVLRSVYYSTTDGLRTLRLVALNQTIFASAGPNSPALPNPFTGTGPGSGALSFRRKVAERSRAPFFNADTGLTDGDTPG